ncbi:hypothetical protein AXF42_Ash003110 [Apostasia shenzhenica]|uniref:Uncharacterized protein n=1 Tax=Apostasia shenzhenica TaxID=1088818 RepID=A0A2I0A856_9ASPA|nr:hypothetical protein AXF42_Ash003110 [Apostasia shenzhenica]
MRSPADETAEAVNVDVHAAAQEQILPTEIKQTAAQRRAWEKERPACRVTCRPSINSRRIRRSYYSALTGAAQISPGKRN